MYLKTLPVGLDKVVDYRNCQSRKFLSVEMRSDAQGMTELVHRCSKGSKNLSVVFIGIPKSLRIAISAA